MQDKLYLGKSKKQSSKRLSIDIKAFIKRVFFHIGTTKIKLIFKQNKSESHHAVINQIHFKKKPIQ